VPVNPIIRTRTRYSRHAYPPTRDNMLFVKCTQKQFCVTHTSADTVLYFLTCLFGNTPFPEQRLSSFPLQTIYCYFCVGFRVPTNQIRFFSNFKVSNVSRLSPSTRCGVAANICKSLYIFNKCNISLEGIFSFA
jgi:hypothetical protein